MLKILIESRLFENSKICLWSSRFSFLPGLLDASKYLKSRGRYIQSFKH